MSESLEAVSYANPFYDYINSHSESSSAAIVPWLCQVARPGSVLDVGCGQGVWAAAFSEQGIERVAGIDGDYVSLDRLKIPVDDFTPADLSEPVELGERFDLAVCLEVAEHLPYASADVLVDTIDRHADAVIFSAAAPHQGGHGHVNEQWPSYWIERLTARGFRAHDVVRPHFWNEPSISAWYRQNAVLFSRAGSPYGDALASAVAGLPSFHGEPLVHPAYWEFKSLYGVGSHAGPAGRLRGFWGSVVSAARRRLARPIG